MLIFIAILASCLVAHSSADCPMTIQDADKCGQELGIFGNRDSIIPSNDAELDAQCKIRLDDIECLKKYVENCVEEFTKQTGTLLITNGGNHLKKRCEIPAERKIYLDHLKCLLPKESGKIEPFHVCYDKSVIILEKIKDLNDDQRMPAACCGYHLYQECIVQNTKGSCGQDSSDYFESVLDEITDSAISFACNNLNTYADCEAHLDKDLWKTLNDLVASDDPEVLAHRHKYHSVIPPLIDIMNRHKMK